MKDDIIKILKKNKYENSWAGNYPYEPEEYAKMIVDYINERYRIEDKKT